MLNFFIYNFNTHNQKCLEEEACWET